MKFKLLFLVCLVAVLSLTSVYVAQAPKPYRGFSMTVPEVVEAAPGDTVIVNGSILNFGWWWLHDFTLTASGLPSSYKVNVTPSYFEDLRILRAWNPEQGVYLTPEIFSVEITVPKDSAGLFTVNVTGQEHQSWKQVSNSTTFILRVSTPPKLSVSDIVVPEQVTESQPFNISFDVKNEGVIDQFANISVTVPKDWTVAPAIKTMTVKSNSTESVIFTITPTNSSGEISVLLLYPYRQTILNITKVGPMLIPKVPSVIPGPVPIPTGLVAFISQLTVLPTWLIIVVIIFAIIILWNLYKVLRTYKFKVVRGKPEEMSEQSVNLPVE